MYRKRFTYNNSFLQNFYTVFYTLIREIWIPFVRCNPNSGLIDTFQWQHQHLFIATAVFGLLANLVEFN